MKIRPFDLLGTAGSTWAADDTGGGGGDDDAGDDKDTPDVSNLQSQIEALRKKNEQIIGTNKSLSKALKAWDGFEPGDAEKLRELMSKAAEDEDKKLKRENDIEAIIERTSDKIRRELLPRAEQAEALAAQLQEETARLKREKAFDRAALDLQIDPDQREAFEALMASRAKWHREDGDDVDQLVVFEGDTPMPFQDWVEKVWSATASAQKMRLAPELPGGSGSRSGNSRSSAMTPERVAAMSQRDYETWRKQQSAA